MHVTIFVADPRSALDAAELIARHGPQAVGEAHARAAYSRDRGNVIGFCRWRQIERLVGAFHADRGAQTHH